MGGHPLEAAGPLTRLSVSWLSPLVTKKELLASDVWWPPESFQPHVAFQQFQGSWDTERGYRRPSMARALLRAFRARFLRAGAILFIFMCLQLSQPFLVRELVAYLRDPDPGGLGWILASLLLLSSLLSSISICQHFKEAALLGVLTRSSAMCAVYDQAVNLSVATRAETSVGQTTNLMSVDAERMLMACQSIHFLWMSPLMMLSSGGIMVYTIGPSALLGLALLLSTIPLQHWLARKGGQIRQRSMALSDERMKLVTEVVQGIRVVKLCGWELAVFRLVARIRREECRHLGAALFMKMLVREGILMMAPALAMALIFASRKISLEEAMLVLGLLNTLRFPLNLLALAMVSVTDCLVSTRRLGLYLQRERAPLVEQKDGEFAVDVEDLHASWGDFQVSIDKWQLPCGSRAAVIGPVASGKTSLLTLLLGEMTGRSGLKGRVAYMAQSPWIQNATLRENILFGQALDEEAYHRVLDCTALRPDLETLCDADLTDIGERGLNLSGGQKARVALARCLYAAVTGRADLLLLDCPFSALDVLTAQTVMEGLLSLTSKCTLLCTMSSHLHLLKHFECVATMDRGRLQVLAPERGHSLETEAVAEVKLTTGATGRGSKMMQADQTRPSQPLRALGKFLCGSQEPIWGYLLALPLLVIFLGGQIWRVLTDVSLTNWASAAQDLEPGLFLCILGLLLASRILCCSFLTSRATRILHNSMFWRLLRARVPSYFDVTTIGEICNKFSKDLDFVDTLLPGFLSDLLSNSSQLLVIFMLTSLALPSFLAILALLMLLLRRLAPASAKLLRRLKALEGQSRSPIYSSFSETLSGLQTIRAWSLQERFREQHMERVRQNVRFYFTSEMAAAWIMLRFELLTVLLIASFSFLAVASRQFQAVDGQRVGIALVYGIQMTALFQRNAQLVMLVGQMLTACERVLSFEELEPETDLVLEKDWELMNWPTGAISFHEVSMRYRDGELVLKKVSFDVVKGSRVGVCGRSGAGKSSLVALLFRLTDPCEGRISMDGVDITSVGLHTLRKNLSLIPQDPVIFHGSLRSNLDPFGEHEDQELQMALSKVDSGFKLDMRVTEQGENLSQGQRQLLCLARVLVSPRRILVLDEATSSVDEDTDHWIKELLTRIWSEGGQTMLTIAHRLGTIIDYDKILVLAAGEVLEYDTPAALRQGSSHFAKMWREVIPDTRLSL